MNNDFLHSDLLVKYIDNELSVEEKQQVEDALKHNVDMQNELNNLRLAKDAIKVYGAKEKVATIHREMMAEMTNNATVKNGIVRSIIRSGMKIAASLFIVVAGIGVYQYTTVSAEKLFDANYQPYTVGVTRGTTGTEAMEKSFQEKNYAEVLNQFKVLSISNQKQNFIAAQSYLATKDYTNAIACFNKVTTLNAIENKNTFKDDTEYYLALCYLKSNQFELANTLFQNIYTNSSHLYNDKLTKKFMLNLKLLEWKK